MQSENGRIYGLTSSTVDLAKHMNHKVTVTGAVTANKEETTNSLGSSTGKPEENFLMKVADLKMVSTSCQ